MTMVLAGLLIGCQTQQPQQRAAQVSTQDAVGRVATNRYYTPANQVLTPAGLQVELPGMRPQALALSPDGRLLVTAGKTHDLVVLDPQSGKVLQRVPLPSEKRPGPRAQTRSPTTSSSPTRTGSSVSPGWSFLRMARAYTWRTWMAASRSSASRRAARWLACSRCRCRRPTPRAARRKSPPASRCPADGKRLYVALNLSNRLAELDAATGKVLRLWDVGVAPYDVVLAGHKAYVSNWGGRRPDASSVTGPAGRGTLVRVDPVRYIASEGSVSVIDLGQAAASPKSEARSPKSSPACTPRRWPCRPTAAGWSSPTPAATR